MKIREFAAEADKLYPRTLSASWDTDGLQCCADPERELKRVLVALDAGKDEIDCAVKGGYDMLLTHHPMIFGGAGDVVPSNTDGRHIIALLTAGVSAASYHTRLDAGLNGVNDCLAAALGLADTETFGDDEMRTAGRIGTLPSPTDARSFAEYVKKALGAPAVRYTGDGIIKRVAVLGGAGKDFAVPALTAGADAIVTGEVPYNAALNFSEMGITVIEAGHYHTEFPVCRRLAQLVADIAGAEADVYERPTQSYV